MSCDRDLIVGTAEAVAMVLASKGCCLTTEGGQRKHSVHSDSSPEQHFSWQKPYSLTACGHVRVRASLCVCLRTCVCISSANVFVRPCVPPVCVCLRQPTKIKARQRCAQDNKKKRKKKRRGGGWEQVHRATDRRHRRSGEGEESRETGETGQRGEVKESRSEAQREDRMKAHGATETETKQQTKENRRAPTLMGTSGASTPPPTQQS